MKKLLFAPALLLAFTACKNDVPSAPAEPATEITVNEAAPPPPPTVEDDGTSVKVGSDGVSVKTKNGDNKTDVQLENGKASVEVK